MPRSARLLLLGGCLLLSLLIAACGGDDDDKTGASATATHAQSTGQQLTATDAPDNGGQDEGRVDACTLLTKDEIAAIVSPAGDGDVTNDEEESACFWGTPSNSDETVVELVVYAETTSDQAHNLFDNSEADPIDGIGDEAHWINSVSTLESLSGNYVISIYASLGAEADQLAASKALAQRVIARLNGESVDDIATPERTEDGSDTGLGEPLNACDLLTKNEVEAELSKSFADPDSIYLDPFSECTWDTTDFTYSLHLNVYHDTREVIEQFYEFSLTDEVESVDDVGEKAEFVGDLGRLEVLQGEYYFEISVSDFEAPDTHRDQTKALARKVVERLP